MNSRCWWRRRPKRAPEPASKKRRNASPHLKRKPLVRLAFLGIGAARIGASDKKHADALRVGPPGQRRRGGVAATRCARTHRRVPSPATHTH
eukprot:4905946-Prymnesium_polylepis.2